MPRPKIYENLVPLTILIEHDMKKEIESKIDNVSDFIRDIISKNFENVDVKKYKKRSKFDDIPEDIAEKYGKRLLLKPWFHQGIIKILYKETGRRFFRRELWDFFKQKYPQIGENKPLWENPDLNPHPVIIDKTKYSKKT